MSAVTTFKVLAGCASLVLILSPSIAMQRVWRAGSVGLLSVVPLVSLLAHSHVWMMYGYLSGRIFPVFAVFVAGDVAALVYLCIYWRFTTERAKANRVLISVFSVLVLLSLYAVLGGLGYLGQSYHGVETTMGFVADVVAVCLYGAPMEKVWLVLKHKSAAYFQIHMVIAGMASNVVWLGYGTLTASLFIVIPNILFLTLGSITLVLYAVYNPKTHPLVRDSDKVDAEARVSISVATSSCTGCKPVDSQCPSFEALHSPLEPIRHD